MPFIDQLQQWVRTRPDHAAVVVGPEKLTFAGLAEAANTGARRNLPVAVIDTPNGTRLAAEFCAGITGKGIAAVLDASWPGELRASVGEAVRNWASTRMEAAMPPRTAGLSDGPPESTFLLGFSSGTSGLPKAFARSRESWRESLVRSTAYFGVSVDTVTLAPGPMAASMNLYALAESIHSGSTFVALPTFSPEAALASITHDAVTRLVLVPTVLGLLAGRGTATGRQAPAVTSIVCAGSSLPPDIVETARRWAPNARIYQYYGASELGFVAASEAFGTAGPTAVGTVFPGVELSIRNSVGEPMPAGETGGICVRSPYVSDGYAWGDDGLAFTVLPGSAGGSGLPGAPWHTVHDQGFVDGSGVLHVVGRASDMIVTSGANVYPQPVEQVLAGGTDPGSVVVTGVPDAVRGQRVVAGLVVGAGPGADGAGRDPEGEVAMLLAAVRKRAASLPAHQRPSRFYALSEPPATGAGKISRALLREWITEGDARARQLH